MRRLGIAGIGVIGPSIDGWRDAVAALTGFASFSAESEVRTAVAAGLPANERRRVPKLTRMVLQCCDDTLSECSAEYPAICSVFASSCGDLVVADQILRALALPEKPVSPTLFHNSVHNSPAGYWSKARGDRSGSTSVSAHDSSFRRGHAKCGRTRLLRCGTYPADCVRCRSAAYTGAVSNAPRIVRRWVVAGRRADSVVDVNQALREDSLHDARTILHWRPCASAIRRHARFRC